MPHLFVRCILLAVADIFRNRSRKEDCLLRHETDFRAQMLLRHLADIYAPNLISPLMMGKDANPKKAMVEKFKQSKISRMRGATNLFTLIETFVNSRLASSKRRSSFF